MSLSTRARFVGSISWLAVACSADDGTTPGNVDKDAAITGGAGGASSTSAASGGASSSGDTGSGAAGSAGSDPASSGAGGGRDAAASSETSMDAWVDGSIGSGAGGAAPILPDGSGDVARDGSEASPDAAAACRYQFCETFEDSRAGVAPDPATWSVDGNPVAVEATRPHNGRMSLHVPPHNGALCVDGAPTCAAARFIRLTNAFPQSLRRQFYGRMFFYIELLPTDNAYYHWMVMEANAGTNYFGDNSGNSSKLAVRQGGEMPQGRGGPNFMMTHLDTHLHQIMPFEDQRRDMPATIALRTWYCLEWYYDAPANQAKYWLNGVERPNLLWQGPKAGQAQFDFPPEFKSVAFGWRAFQVSSTPFEAYIDDIALDAQKIGCN